MELKQKYENLMAKAIDSKDEYKMKVIGDVESYFFGVLEDKYPELARQWVEKLEAMDWHNYLTKMEAESIVNKFSNQDGTKGAHWSYDVFKNAVESLGAPLFETPYFNCWSLWVVANMIYSDHSKTLIDLGIAPDKMPLVCYKLAVDKLKDSDRPHFVRNYFKVDD